MITDSHNFTWIQNEDRSLWTCSDGRKLIVNPAMDDEQVLAAIESMYAIHIEPEPQTNTQRIAELEAQVKALLARLS